MADLDFASDLTLDEPADAPQCWRRSATTGTRWRCSPRRTRRTTCSTPTSTRSSSASTTNWSALEMLALRRLTTAAFGTLMALEPAFAMIVGLVVLDQVPASAGVVGICLVVAAGTGAARTGARQPTPVPAEIG